MPTTLSLDEITEAYAFVFLGEIESLSGSGGSELFRESMEPDLKDIKKVNGKLRDAGYEGQYRDFLTFFERGYQELREFIDVPRETTEILEKINEFKAEAQRRIRTIYFKEDFNDRLLRVRNMAKGMKQLHGYGVAKYTEGSWDESANDFRFAVDTGLHLGLVKSDLVQYNEKLHERLSNPPDHLKGKMDVAYNFLN